MTRLTFSACALCLVLFAGCAANSKAKGSGGESKSATATQERLILNPIITLPEPIAESFDYGVFEAMLEPDSVELFVLFPTTDLTEEDYDPLAEQIVSAGEAKDELDNIRQEFNDLRAKSWKELGDEGRERLDELMQDANYWQSEIAILPWVYLHPGKEAPPFIDPPPIHPSIDRGSVAGTIAKTEITNNREWNQLAAALIFDLGHVYDPWLKALKGFYPRYGIRVKEGKKSYLFLISYQCNIVRIFDEFNGDRVGKELYLATHNSHAVIQYLCGKHDLPMRLHLLDRH